MVGKNALPAGLWAAALAAACAGSPIAPELAACRSGVSALLLSVGQPTAIDPGPTEGCVVFPANASTTDSAEYLLVPQVTTESPDFRSSFKLAGALGAMAAPPVAALVQGASLPPAERFHRMLREMERTRTYPAPSEAPGARTPTIALTSGMDTLGNVRPFLVLASIHGSPLVSVVATAQSVGQHIALYVDNAAPFYSIVADRDSTPSCPHPISQVKQVIPVTFIHEFQHMISYNQHVLLRGGGGELPWLNEGMSHYAEELGGRAILAGTGGTDS